MYLDVFSDNSFATNCWLLAAGGRDEALVVDPGFSAARVHGMLERAGKTPVAALATHGHHDHVGAAATFCGDEIPLYIHEADHLALLNPGAWGAGYETAPIFVKDVRAVHGGDRLEIAGIGLDVWHTPGHTPGSVCYVADDLVFSGDLVFRDSIGRYDLPNSSAGDMRSSLGRFLELSDELPVKPGHGPVTTVGRERAKNPFLKELV
jgi:hydroxyacylglutathione hydrolase